MRLKERVAIVTGGARGIGAGIARCLVDDGAQVGKLTAFLCSDDARNITGQVIALDGGSTLKGGA